MPVRHIDEIGELYSKNVSPVTDKEIQLEVEEAENRKRLLNEGEQVKGDNSGKDSAFAGTKGHDHQKNDGPEAAEGWEPAQNDPNLGSADQSVHEPKKFSNPVKKEQKEINNSTMKEQNFSKSTFDRLFEDVMGGEEVDLDTDVGMDEDPFADEGDDMGGGDLPDRLREVAELLVGIADDMGGGEEEEVGGIEDMEDVADLEGDEFGESYTNFDHDHNFTGGQAVADGAHEHVGMQGASNKVSGKGHQVSGHGHGDGGAAGQDDGGKPKPVGGGQAQLDGAHTKVGLQGMNNKVGGKVTGGKDFFRA